MYSDDHNNICNTASLFAKTEKLLNATACEETPSYFGKQLLKDTASFDNYKDNLEKPEELWNAVSEKSSHGFNYNDRTAVFVIDIDISNITKVLGTNEFKVEDQLPDGFTHEEYVVLGKN